MGDRHDERTKLPTSAELDTGLDDTVHRSSLVVGPADDAHERDADRVADSVVTTLRNQSAAPSGRVQRKAPLGAAGGPLDGDTSDAISRRRGGGAPLQGDVRRDMETGFGTDLGGIRLHTGSEASQLNESMSAQAFTVGNDIFMHDSAPTPGTDAGQHLLAHEIAHTMQNGGGAHRQIRRKMMSKAKFNEITYEGKFTGASKAQKSIRVLLENYHADFPWESQLSMSSDTAQAAVERLEEMRDVARRWIDDHTLENPDTGAKKSDPKRVQRRIGMNMFMRACENEMLTMRDLIQYKSSGDVTGSDHDLSNVQITAPSDEYTKIKEKYEGDATSGFRRLGFLIDAAVPMDGDKSAIKMEITIPIPPGFITLEFGADSERDGDHVKAGLTVGVSGGASVGSVAKLSAGIGCFLNAKAKTGADVCELMSYALFRRCRQSPVIPREITNGMFGGRTDDFGWQKAEDWSLGVENRIFEDDPDAEVSSGVYGKLAANVSLSKDLASMGLEVKGTSGDTINKESIEREKGATGARNKTSGGSLVAQGGGMRGTTQKSLATQNFGLELALSGAFGILSGSIKESLGWSKKRENPKTGKLEYDWDKFQLSGTIAGKMPMNKTAGDKIINAIPKYVQTINRLIRAGMQSAQEETKARAGGAVVGEVGEWAAIVGELTSVPKETWQPFAASPPSAGTSIGSTANVELSVSFDFPKSEFVVELRLGQSSALAKAIQEGSEVIQVFKVDISKSSRLLKLTHNGSGWALS